MEHDKTQIMPPQGSPDRPLEGRRETPWNRPPESPPDLGQDRPSDNAPRVFTGAELHAIAQAAMRGESTVPSPHGGDVLDLTSPDLLAELGRPKRTGNNSSPWNNPPDSPRKDAHVGNPPADGDDTSGGDLFDGGGGLDVGAYLDRVTVGHERIVQNAITGLKDRALKEILSAVDYSTTGGMTVDEYRAIECCRRMCISILRLDPYCGQRRGRGRSDGNSGGGGPDDAGPRPGRDTKHRSPYDDPSLYPRFTNTSGPRKNGRPANGPADIAGRQEVTLSPGVSPGVCGFGVSPGVDERGGGPRIATGADEPPTANPPPACDAARDDVGINGVAPRATNRDRSRALGADGARHSGDESRAACRDPAHQPKPRSVFTVAPTVGGMFLRTSDALGDDLECLLGEVLPRPP